MLKGGGAMSERRSLDYLNAVVGAVLGGWLAGAAGYATVLVTTSGQAEGRGPAAALRALLPVVLWAWAGATAGTWAALRAGRAPRAGRTAALVGLLFPLVPLGALACGVIPVPHWSVPLAASAALAALACLARAAACGLFAPEA
jgi:hypothetical protein